MPPASSPKPTWLYRVCRGDGDDLREVAAPLHAGPLDHRLQVLDAVVNGSSKRSPWLHWTLDKHVADKYRMDGRRRYGDACNFVIRVDLRDPRTMQDFGMNLVRRVDKRETVRNTGGAVSMAQFQERGASNCQLLS